MRKRIALFVLLVAIVAGAELKHVTTTHSGPIPPQCPPSGCSGNGNSGK